MIRHRHKIREAQARCLTIRSLDHLQAVVVGDDGLLEKHTLLAVYPREMTNFMEVDMAFPYPFAGMSSQEIWWEDILQTGKVIHKNQQTSLTRLLKVTQPANQPTSQPAS